MKTPTAKARALLLKLQALAERGIGGEQSTAKRKLAQLKAAYDFALPEEGNREDLFSGRFRTTRGPAVVVAKITDVEVANFVKWAIESATGIHCTFRGAELLAQATPASARRLATVAETIANGFCSLWKRFAEEPGVDPGDRGAFFCGLYDGMMGEARGPGQPLPGRRGVKRVKKAGRRSVGRVAGLHVHPYTVAVGLGKQIRFAVPTETLVGELERALAGEIAPAAD